jgi:hypothetical protein
MRSQDKLAAHCTAGGVQKKNVFKGVHVYGVHAHGLYGSTLERGSKPSFGLALLVCWSHVTCLRSA